MMIQPMVVVATSLGIALLIAAAGRRAVPLTRYLALGGPIVAVVAGIGYLRAEGAGPSPYIGGIVTQTAEWLSVGGRSVTVGFAADALSAVMLLVVGVVAAMVVTFSIGYMAEDSAQPRYFALLSLFTGAMTALVMASSLIGLFVAWELVGACSYLLIGFWFTKPSAADAAVKAFLVTRIGDVGLLFGMAVLWRETGSLALDAVVAAVPTLTAGTVTLVALLLFVGAAGKSAQFPLHVWLPDAMEGPTPVSALIHAATMVAAGVFLIARVWPVFEAAEAARTVVLVVGTLTALGAAMVAVVQTDIKRVLAYSTISQLGFMFAALGAGAWVAAVFHLVTHAAFKSLLFLASGSVIHGSGTQDLREMGGLGASMRTTFATWSIGVAALAGVPPLAGFFSKDAVLDAVFEHAPVAGVALFIASALTAFYAARATQLAFGGAARTQRAAHESGLVMLVPLVVLATGALGLGAGAWWFAERFGGHAGLSLPVAAVSTVLALAGAAVAWRGYAAGPGFDDVLATRLGVMWRGAASAWGVDALAMRLARMTQRGSEGVSDRIDKRVIDGLVDGAAKAARRVGAGVTSLQSGEGSLYAALVGVGAIVVVCLAIVLGRRG